MKSAGKARNNGLYRHIRTSKEIIRNLLNDYHNNREDDGMIDAKSIGIIIRELRVKKGITQEQLSGLAALDRTHYSKIERGLRSPNVDTLFKIAFALNMKPHELVEIIEENVEFKFE